MSKINQNHPLQDEKTYRAYHALSASDIKLLSQSYAHYAHKRDYPEDYNFSVALRYGTIIHAAVLEPERFAEEFVVPPEINKRTKSGKEEWAEWEKENASKFAITKEELDKAEIIRNHCFKNPKAKELLTGGTAEVPMTWDEEVDGTGFHFKARADYLKDYGDTRLVIDLKTVQEASEEYFQRSMARWRYPIQAYHYTQGFGEGSDCHFIWVVVEKNPPYGCAIYSATPSVLELGKKWRAKGLENYLRGEGGEAEELPYPTVITPIELPRWVRA